MTDNYELLGSIRRSLLEIADHYDQTLEPVKRAAGSPVKGSREKPLPINEHVLNAREEARRDLWFWAGFALENVTSIDGEHLSEGPSSNEVCDLAAFVSTWADWIVTNRPDDADNLATETAAHAKTLKAIALPERREWMPIGECPVTVADDQGNSVVCGATVRAYDRTVEDLAWTSDGDGSERKLKRIQFIKCPGCGTEDTIDWWISQIVPEGSDKATATEVIAFVAMRAGVVLRHDQLRKWKSLGHVLGHGKDVKGRTLYSSAAVLAYAQHQTKEEAA